MSDNNESLYQKIDNFFEVADELIDFENKTLPEIIKQVVKHTYKAKIYHSLVKKDIDHLLVDIENIYGKKYKYLVETSKRSLDVKSMQYYVNCDDDVVKLRKMYEGLCYYQNRIQAIIDTLDKFSWQINNLTKILIEKMDTFTI